MPGRVARVHGQVFEAMDLRPVAVDDERGDPVRRRLDGEDEDDESSHAPVTHDRERQRSRSDDDREDDSARAHRPDQREIRPERRSVGREPTDEVLVVGRYAVHVQQHPRDEKAEGGRHGGDESEPCEHHAQEDEHRMVGPDPNGGSFDSAVPWLQNRRRPTFVGPGDCSSGLGERRVHSPWFPI